MLQRTIIIVAGVLIAASAHAHQGDRPHHHPHQTRGTYFIAEAGAGPTFGTGFAEQSSGLSLRATIGVGSAFRGFPPRFYLIGVTRTATLSAQVTRGTQISKITRQLFDASAGLRILVPWGRFRALFEFTMGSSVVNSSALVNERERYNADEKRFTLYTAMGAQYRLHRNISLGFAVEWSLPTNRDARDFVLEVSRVDDNGELHGWTTLNFSVVGHF
jgi:hypothetical protein